MSSSCCCNFCLDGSLAPLDWVCSIGSSSRCNSKGYEKLDEKKNGKGSLLDEAGIDLQYRNLISNPTFVDGTHGWTGQGCSLSTIDIHGSTFCIATGRKERTQGPTQEIGKRLEPDVEYDVEARVAIGACRTVQGLVKMTMKVGKVGGGEDVMELNSVIVKKGKWQLLTGKLLLRKQPTSAKLSFNGPERGVEVLVSRVVVVPSSPITTPPLSQAITLRKPIKSVAQRRKTPKYNVNIIKEEVDIELGKWYAQGNCTLTVLSGGPLQLGSIGLASFVNVDPPALSGNYIIATDRTETFEGPAQNITDQIQLFTSYQVAGWVAVNRPGDPYVDSQAVNVALDVDGVWVTGGEVMAKAGGQWTELVGSFRLEEQPKEVIVYFQGPDPGVELLVSGFQIFAPDRLARVPLLQKETDRVRKRDVILKIRDVKGQPLPKGTRVILEQEQNTFPLGTCINHDSLEDGPYRRFFLDHFTWAVFDWEFKWDQLEPDEDDVSYAEVDDMVDFCVEKGINMRGHCLLWDKAEQVQDWLKDLTDDELEDAVQAHIKEVIGRYRGYFTHYDVNNEILHGSFYETRLGPQALPWFFKVAHNSDPNARLFLNDYDILSGYDADSSPQKYIELVKFLLDNGAPVGGIGVQGHMKVPIGPLIGGALNALGVLNFPIWFTELTVESLDEYVRADDLEVCMREAYANDNVEGVLLWGFFEGTMCLPNGSLVNADGEVNEAGRRLLALKAEWRCDVDDTINEDGDLLFRGFIGKYTIILPDSGQEAAFEIPKVDGTAIAFVTV